jgi:hypothetical protein
MIAAESEIKLFTRDFVSWDIHVIPDSLVGLGRALQAPNGSLFASKNTRYASTGDLYRSIDNGRTWQWLRFDNYVSLYGIDSSGWVYYDQQRTTDNGITWEVFNLPSNINPPITAFGSEGEIVSFIGNGIIVTTSGGVSWDTIRYREAYSPVIKMMRLRDGTIIIQEDSDTLFVTTDLGGHWSTSRPPGQKKSFVMCSDEQGRVFIARKDTSILYFDPITMEYRAIADQPAGTSVIAMIAHNGTFLVYTGKGYFTTTLSEFASVPRRPDMQKPVLAYYDQGFLTLPIEWHGTIEIIDLTGRSMKTINLVEPYSSVFVGDLPGGCFFARSANALARFSVLK